MFLGFVVSWALIYNAENSNHFSPTLALWCVSVPLFDFFAVVILRKFEKRSLFIANKDHIHHFLKNLGFSKFVILILISIVSLIMLSVGFFIEEKFTELSFPIYILLFFIYLYGRFSLRLTKKK